jgi:hypothetical protein
MQEQRTTSRVLSLRMGVHAVLRQPAEENYVARMMRLRPNRLIRCDESIE